MTYRVAMVAACPYPVPQGSQVLVKNTATALHNRGHDIHLVVYGYGTREAQDPFPIHRGPQPIFARKTTAGPSFTKPFRDAMLVATLRRVIRQHDIQIVHAHNYEGLLVALAARHRPIVYHAHNAMADELSYFVRPIGIARFAGIRLDKIFPRRADKIIAPHDGLREYLIKIGRCSPAKITVVPPSIELDGYESSVGTDGLPRILYTGNLDRYQNLDFLQRVIKRVKQDKPEIEFVIATSAKDVIPGAEMISIETFEDLQRVLSQDAIVVCPRVSWSGYPIKLLNAMAAGKPIVTCVGAGHPLTPNKSALMAANDDVEGFAQAVLRLLKDRELRESLGSEARRAACERHNAETVATAIEAVYDEALSVSGGPSR